MRIDIITVLPEILESPFNHSIIKRAQEKGLAEIHLHNLRDYSEDKHRKVDDYSFGKGAGMVMAIQPIEKAIETLKSQRKYDEIIFTTPDGHLFNQKSANLLSMKQNSLRHYGNIGW